MAESLTAEIFEIDGFLCDSYPFLHLVKRQGYISMLGIAQLWPLAKIRYKKVIK